MADQLTQPLVIVIDEHQGPGPRIHIVVSIKLLSLLKVDCCESGLTTNGRGGTEDRVGDAALLRTCKALAAHITPAAIAA